MHLATPPPYAPLGDQVKCSKSLPIETQPIQIRPPRPIGEVETWTLPYASSKLTTDTDHNNRTCFRASSIGLKSTTLASFGGGGGWILQSRSWIRKSCSWMGILQARPYVLSSVLSGQGTGKGLVGTEATQGLLSSFSAEQRVCAAGRLLLRRGENLPIWRKLRKLLERWGG